MSRPVVVLIAFICLPGVPVVFSADEPKAGKVPPKILELLKLDGKAFIQRFDKNKDGYLSKHELPGKLGDHFEQFDTDGNGKLDEVEVDQMLAIARNRLGIESDKPAKPGKPGKQGKPENQGKSAAKDTPEVDRMVDFILERMDTDKDGRISRAEAKNQVAERFDMIDTNKDGFLDRKELRRVAERMLAMRGSQSADRPAVTAWPTFDSLDKDADGRLTRDEVKGSPIAAHFDEIDANKDGQLDPAEYAEFVKRRQEGPTIISGGAAGAAARSKK